MELPELPASLHDMPGRQARELEAWGIACAQAALEAAAEVCVGRASTVSMLAKARGARDHNATVRGCAAAIRAIQVQP